MVSGTVFGARLTLVSNAIPAIAIFLVVRTGFYVNKLEG